MLCLFMKTVPEVICPKTYEGGGRVQWLTPVIPAFWEAKVDGSPEFETSLANMAKLCLY